MTASPSFSLLLFGERGARADSFAPAVRTAAAHAEPSGTAGLLDTITDRIATDEIEVALDRACGTRIGDLLLRAWRLHAALGAAAQLSLKHRGTEQPVVLGDHAITAEQHPEIDVVISGVPALTISLALLARLQVTNVVAVVSGGALTALRGGSIDASIALSAEDVPVASTTVRLDVDTALPLPEPVILRTPDLVPGPRKAR